MAWLFLQPCYNLQILQDNRVNGVCGASRLLGVYHLWPQIIPIPSTESVELRTEDEYIILATHSLWQHLTYEQVTHETRSLSDPTQAAKRLRDLAVAHGCKTDLSVIVIKLKIDMDPPTRSLHQLQPLEALLLPNTEEEAEEEEDEEEEEEEEPGVTNIDDVSDDEEEEEGEGRKEESGGLLLPMDYAVQEDMDRRVLSAIGSPLSAGDESAEHMEGDQPLMQSTNFDDLPLSDGSPDRLSPLATDSTPSDLPTMTRAGDRRRGGGEEGPRKSSLSYRQQQQLMLQKQQLLQQNQLEYEAQTLPKIASQSKRTGGYTDLETSFEQTQVCYKYIINVALCFRPQHMANYIYFSYHLSPSFYLAIRLQKF